MERSADSKSELRMVSDLYGRHQGEDIFVVGTGPSLRAFPLDVLQGKTVIGCNMAWKVVPVQYGVTIHPDLNMPECMEGEQPRPDIIWVTKHRKTRRLLTPEQFERVRSQFYYFEAEGKPNSQPSDEPNDSGRILDWVRRPTENFLYQWSSISQTACNFAANLGAKTVILVGCDNTSLFDSHHAHQQHTRWKGVDPNHRYRQYYEGLAEVRSALRERGVSLVSMTPFLSLDRPEEDFLRLCGELGKEAHVSGADLPAGDKAKSPIKRVRRAWKRRLDALAGRTNG
jgi:hypothetical protein